MARYVEKIKAAGITNSISFCPNPYLNSLTPQNSLLIVPSLESKIAAARTAFFKLDQIILEKSYKINSPKLVCCYDTNKGIGG